MLTRSGWMVLVLAIVLVVSGRLLGVLEFFVLAAAAGVLLAGCAIYTGIIRLRLEVAREVHPPRVHAGALSRVDVRVENQGTHRSPVLRLFDGVSGTRGARMMVRPLSPGSVAHAAYRLPTDRRGILRIGPLEVVLGDPFGLTEIPMTAAGRAELTVYPHIDEISAVPHTSGDDPHSGADHPSSIGRSGEDFYALRPYVVGDDFRRVHWRATAHHDELMVRQDELPWQGRATVLVDIREATNTPESLELAISAAASIVSACWKRQDLVRLISTDGADSGFATGHAQMEAILEHLATVEAAPEGAYRRVLDRLSRSAIGGALVAVVCAMPDQELQSMLRLGTRFGSVAIVRFDPSSWDPRAPDAPTDPVGGTLLRVTGDQPFPMVWERAMSPIQRTGSAVRIADLVPPAQARSGSTA